ncbi:hypothetical protein JG688_00002377, partial [Phytophthora aleatoria]
LIHTIPQRDAVNRDEASDDEDPGDNVDGDITLSMWGEYLDEVFEDDEIDAAYTATRTNASNNGVTVSRNSDEEYSDDEDSKEFEEIAEAVKQNFPDHNDRNFPQEDLVLHEFRGQKVTLTELFG